VEEVWRLTTKISTETTREIRVAAKVKHVSLVCIPRVSPLKRAISVQLISVIYDSAGAALFSLAEETKNMKIESNVSGVIRGVENEETLELQRGTQWKANFLWDEVDLTSLFVRFVEERMQMLTFFMMFWRFTESYRIERIIGSTSVQV
jgi:hypothetical protein